MVIYELYRLKNFGYMYLKLFPIVSVALKNHFALKMIYVVFKNSITSRPKFFLTKHVS